MPSGTAWAWKLLASARCRRRSARRRLRGRRARSCAAGRHDEQAGSARTPPHWWGRTPPAPRAARSPGRPASAARPARRSGGTARRRRPPRAWRMRARPRMVPRRNPFSPVTTSNGVVARASNTITAPSARSSNRRSRAATRCRRRTGARRPRAPSRRPPAICRAGRQRQRDGGPWREDGPVSASAWRFLLPRPRPSGRCGDVRALGADGADRPVACNRSITTAVVSADAPVRWPSSCATSAASREAAQHRLRPARRQGRACGHISR